MPPPPLLLSALLVLFCSHPLLAKASAEVRCFCNLPQCVATGHSTCRSPSGVCVVVVVEEEGTRRDCAELLLATRTGRGEDTYCASDDDRRPTTKTRLTLLCCITEDICNEVASSSSRFRIRYPSSRSRSPSPFRTASALALIVGGLLLLLVSASRVRRRSSTAGTVRPLETRVVAYGIRSNRPVPDAEDHRNSSSRRCESVVSLGPSDDDDSSRDKYFVFDA